MEMIKNLNIIILKIKNNIHRLLNRQDTGKKNQWDQATLSRVKHKEEKEWKKKKRKFKICQRIRQTKIHVFGFSVMEREE